MKIHLLRLENTPIYRQLQIEEALLRVDKRNWCIINHGSPPAIVMGISAKPELLVNREKMQRQPLPLIRRFSGGGTVAIDPNTLFVTTLFNADEVSVPCFPQQVLQWNATLYRTLLKDLPFEARENDYVLGERKFGGNAQYFIKNRWLHHSSLLWDYNEEMMEYLLHPAKTPEYRKGRNHSDFLCRLRAFLEAKEMISEGVISALKAHGEIVDVSLAAVEEIVKLPHRKGLRMEEVRPLKKAR